MAKRIGFIAIGLVLLVVIVAGGFLVGMRHHFHPSAPHLHDPPAASTLEAQRQDIRYFRQLIALDRSFAPTVGLKRIENWRCFRLSVPTDADLLGGRVTAIDGQSIDVVMTKLEQLRGGTPQWRRLYASQYLVLQDLLYGIDVAPDMRHSNWTVETPAGASITRRLDAYAPPASEPAVFVKRWLSSEPLTGMAEQWRAVEPDRPLPISLTDFDTAFRSLALPGTCTQFVQLKSNADEGGQNIKDFLSSTESRLRQIQPCNVILDLRYDDGGDFVNTYGFARELPKPIPPAGQIIMLTGPVTFSAGISTAAFVKHAGQGRVVIVGEPVGDRLQFFSEGGWACLPNSQLCVAYETGKHDYQHACTDWDVCFWLNYFFQFRVKSLDPDEVIPLSFKDWRAGVDPVLDHAIALATATTRG
jgi:hypothetical protein